MKTQCNKNKQYIYLKQNTLAFRRPWSSASVLKSSPFCSLGTSDSLHHLHTALCFSLSEGWVVRFQGYGGKSRGFFRSHNSCFALCPVEDTLLGRPSWTHVPPSVRAKRSQPKGFPEWTGDNMSWGYLFSFFVISTIRNYSLCFKWSAVSNHWHWQYSLAL